MTHLRISYDQGASLVKALYQLDKRVGVVTIDPEILHLPKSSIQAYREGTGNLGGLNSPFPENDAWLTYKRSSEHCFVLGHLARQFHGSSNLDQLKFEQGTAKLMAVIGSIIQKEGLDSEVEVDIAALLPYGEYVNSKQFIAQFSREAKNYYFRNQKINVSTENFDCVPEGGGFIASLVREHSKEWLARRKIVVLMCGHRNTSLLIFEKGLISQDSQTTDLGFIRLVESVINKTSLDNTEAVTKAIYEAGNNIEPKNSSLRVLIKSYMSENFETEAQQISEAIHSSRREYWTLIQNWLQANLPKELDEIIIAGGSAYYLRDEFDHFLSWAEPSWGGDSIPERFQNAFESYPDQDSLMLRFKDVCALHLGIYRKAVSV